MPEKSCRRNRPGLSRSSPTAWSATFWTDRPPLLQRQRDEARLAVRVGHQQHRDLLTLALEIVDALLQISRRADALILHLNDDVARREMLVGRIAGGAGIDSGDHDAFD